MKKLDLSILYNIKQEKKVFIDTNILIFLFSPYSMSREYDTQKETYSEVLGLLMEYKSKLYINSIVISEFINVSLKLDFNKNFNKNDDKDFKKDYRGSKPYKCTLNSILVQLKQILKICDKIDDDFKQFNVLDEFTENTNLDFNDVLIADTVIHNKLEILTNDQDFQGYKDINIEWYYR
ncbi:type II toxin-antitoxin system VapC family toxin [Arcobacteraceae bacterium]|nr:type II toxin-antitoxin system VapC family toxin [Arcobacteraceae bacterium]